MSKPKHDDLEQSRRFIEMATELRAFGSASSLNRSIRAIAASAKTKREPLKPRKRSAKKRAS
jgi:hypothetical protein